MVTRPSDGSVRGGVACAVPIGGQLGLF